MTEVTNAVAPFAFAPISADQSATFVKALVKAQRKNDRDHEKADTTLVTTFRDLAASLGCELTAAQYSKQIAPNLRKAAKKATISDVEGFLSRAKLIVLARCNDPAPPEPVEGEPAYVAPSVQMAGESQKTYLGRLASYLEGAKTPSGAWVWPHDDAGALIKSGRQTGSTTEPAPTAEGTATPSAPTDDVGSAGASRDAEGGLDVSRDMAAALILMKGSEPAASRLVRLLTEHRKEFEKWATSVLTAEAERAPPAPSASAKAILEMANGKKR